MNARNLAGLCALVTSLWLAGGARAEASGLPGETEVAAAVEAIERICGTSIERMPAFELASGGPLGCWYDPASHTIKVAGHFARPAERVAADRDELAKYRKLLLFHELLHAWQYQELPIAEVVRDGLDRRVLWAILEGHALLCEEIYAEELGAGELARRVHAGARGASPIQLPDGLLDVHFVYSEGKRFVAEAAGTKPSRDDVAAVLRSLPTQVEVLNPKEYLERTSALAFYAAAVERERAVEIADILERLRQGHFVDEPWQQSDIRVADIAGFLRGLPTGRREIEDLSRSARYGLRIATIQPEATITIIGLTDADRAHRVRILLERQLVRSGARRSTRLVNCPPGVCRSQLRLVSDAVDADRSADHETATTEISLYRIDRYVVEVSERLSEQTSLARREEHR